MHSTAIGKMPLIKLLLVMKMTAFLLIACFLQVAARTTAQVTLKERSASLEKVLDKIKQQSGYGFVYNDGLIRSKGKPVQVDVSNVPVEKALEEIFKGQDQLTYTLNGKIISVKEKESDKNSASLTPELRAGLPLPAPPPTVRGRITNEKGEAVAGVNISLKGGKVIGVTNDNGEFTLTNVADNATLVFSAVSIETAESGLNGRTVVNVAVKTKVALLDDIAVQMNTGYQKIPRERATGSFTFLKEEQLDQRIAPDIISKLEGITNGLAFNKDLKGNSSLRIRGESTLYGNPQPLIVVDNFPYDGDINNLNPNDIENVTFLKDAAAASIWGVQAGNGVIVITTKKSKYNQPLKVELNANTTVADKPYLKYRHSMASSDFVGFEQFLFGKGYFDSYLQDVNLPAVSPGVEILNDQKNGLISATEAGARLAALRNIDWAHDVSQYVYRKPVHQQYQLNLSSGSQKASYYFSGGYDRDLANTIFAANQRISLNSQASFRPLAGLQFNVGLFYNEASQKTGYTGMPNLYPYTQLADAQGNQLNMPIHRSRFEDTITNRGFLNWKYYPLSADNQDQQSKQNETRVLTGLKYGFNGGIGIEILYQYQRSVTDVSVYYSPESYSMRDRYNKFAILDSKNNFTGSNFNARQLGRGMLDNSENIVQAHYGRAALTFNHTWRDHSLSALGGFETRQTETKSSTGRLNGFDRETGSIVFPNLFTSYPTYPNLGTSMIEAPGTGISIGGTLDRFRSWFSNAAYTYKDRYSFSASARLDGSNYFGVTTNQKTVPLWSAGFKWDINKEKFYHFDLLSQVSLRATYGFSGNLDRNLAAVTTIRFNQFTDFNTGLPYAAINNIPNPELRWEKVGMLNIGIDFSSKNSRMSGSIEYYQKNGNDLIGDAILDPTTGVAIMRGNFSGMKSNGLDIQISSKNIDRTIKWTSTLIFNYVNDKVTRYDVPNTNYVSWFGSLSQILPIVGQPLYPVYSYYWAGLDPATGDPRIYLGDTINHTYTTTTSSALQRSDIHFNGRYNPPIFGSLMNDISWKQLSLSFNITYKFDYYFRRNSIDYGTLYKNWRQEGNDYSMRWQNPGDEKTTDVPSLVYPFNSQRDVFYKYADVLVEKGDHIRLQFISLSYSMNRQLVKRLPFQSLQFNFYMNNVGILWRANEHGIDPDYQNADFPAPRTYSFGVKAIF
jgi:TonB-linked SusC/RagA family outer membrane protein